MALNEDEQIKKLRKAILENESKLMEMKAILSDLESRRAEAKAKQEKEATSIQSNNSHRNGKLRLNGSL